MAVTREKKTYIKAADICCQSSCYCRKEDIGLNILIRIDVTLSTFQHPQRRPQRENTCTVPRCLSIFQICRSKIRNSRQVHPLFRLPDPIGVSLWYYSLIRMHKLSDFRFCFAQEQTI